MRDNQTDVHLYYDATTLLVAYICPSNQLRMGYISGMYVEGELITIILI